MTELDLFAAAVATADAAARAALLDRECGGNPALRERLDKLLAAHFAAQPQFDPQPDGTRSFADAAPTADPDGTRDRPGPAEAEGAVIAGRYKLRQQIGEGGMGTVWMADQTEPVKRKVAVKLIRVERGQSRTILARFEAERQAIALMDHPHIAKLLDAGTTDAGAPFFVMELVKGVPLNDFCDQHRLTVAERLNLFQQVCSAVQHAHQKGVIHRDLKPSNILVESHDGKPVPKVIDFGLAKATTGLQLTDYTLFTAFGSVMGTPLYMAPEQATFNAVDVDTRADVYALGVILYELLTGTTPLTRETLKKAALDEMLKLVREQEAPTPSSRLSSSEAKPTVAANRQTEPAKLGSFVKGELDWIVLKALAKDRDRRYDSATNFAKDVERFLAHEPVTAGPPSAGYRLKKFVRRNRGQVLAASLVLLALVAGVVGTTAGLVRAEAARSREAEEREKAERLASANATLAEREIQARNEAVVKRLEAEKNLAYAREGQRVILGVFNRMTDNEATRANPQRTPVGGRTARPAQSDNEATRANLQQAAKELSANAVGDPVSMTQLRIALADALVRVKDPKTAVELYEAARPLRAEQVGADHPDMLDFDLRQAQALSDHGEHKRAVALYEDVVIRSHAAFGPKHEQTLLARYRYAKGCLAAARHDDVLDALESLVPLCEAHLGPDHNLTIGAMYTLVMRYLNLEMHEEGFPFFRRVISRLEAHKEKTGNGYPDTYLLGHAYRGLPGIIPTVQIVTPQPINDATKAYEEVRDRLGPLAPESLLARRQLAEALLRHPRRNPPQRALDEPETILFEVATAVRDRKPHDEFRAETARQFGDLLATRTKQHPESWRTHRAQSRHGQVLSELGQVTAAEPLLLAGYQGLKSREVLLPEAASTAIPEALDRLIALYLAANNRDEVKKYRELRAKYPSGLALPPKEPEKPNPPAVVVKPPVGPNPKVEPKPPAVKPGPDLTAMENEVRKQLAKLDPKNPGTRALPESLTRGYQAVGAEHAWFGREKEWSEMCGRALEMAKGTKDPSTADRVAKVCCILPTDDKDRLDSILTLARAGVEYGKGHQYFAYYQLALGMAEYRCGLFADADKTLSAAHAGGKQHPQIDGTASFFRAMALFRLGKADDAHKLFDEAEKRTRPKPADGGGPLASGTNPDDIVVWLSHKEAKRVLRFDAAPQGSAAAPKETLPPPRADK